MPVTLGLHHEGVRLAGRELGAPKSGASARFRHSRAEAQPKE
jgi:hypothetical protein